MSNSDWKERGDGWHWDHPDGSFIEKELGTRAEFGLYNDDCDCLGRFPTLAAAHKAHAALGTANASPKAQPDTPEAK